MVGGWCGAVQGMPKWRSFVGYVASLAGDPGRFSDIKQKLFDGVLRRFCVQKKVSDEPTNLDMYGDGGSVSDEPTNLDQIYLSGTARPAPIDQCL